MIAVSVCNDPSLFCLRDRREPADDKYKRLAIGDIGGAVAARAYRHNGKEPVMLVFGHTVADWPLLKMNVTVVKRVEHELRDICHYTGVCVTREMAEKRARGELGAPGIKFDTFYDPSYTLKGKNGVGK